tara:strand:+ start:778 stop:879 length:102 start_codon:yes stop_codon:yes gene_type:complete
MDGEEEEGEVEVDDNPWVRRRNSAVARSLFDSD